jgi:hypothetical protein
MVHRIFSDGLRLRGVYAMKTKKLTIEVPEDLLAKATAVTGQGLTPTVRKERFEKGSN